MIRNALSVIQSNIGLLARKLSGVKVSSFLVSLVSIRASIKTSGAGSHISLGRRTAIRPNTEISATDGGKISIGSQCFINRNCLIAAHKSIVVGKGTTIGPGCYIYDHDHDGNGGFVCKSVEIGDGVWIGAGCIILKGVKVGNNAVIAAGSVITKNINGNVTCYNKRETIEKNRS